MNTAFQKVYTKITQITKATCSLKAQGVGNDELAIVNGRLAQVVKIWGEDITLQVFSGTEGIPTNAEVTFLGKAPTLKVGEDLCGRFFNAFGDPIDGGPAVDGEEREIGGPSVNPVRRKQPSELIATGIAGIDLNNTLVSGQKIPFFCRPGSTLLSGDGECGFACTNRPDYPGRNGIDQRRLSVFQKFVR